MKALIIYYSYEGNTRLVAEGIKEELGCDIFELKPINEKHRTSKLLKYMWGGSQVMMKKSPELLSLPQNLEDYDTIILGTPVWAWNFAPPFRTLFERISIKDKRIALFTTNEGQNGKTFQHFRGMLPGNEFIGELELFAPTKRDKDMSLNRAREWAKGLI